MVPAPLTPLHRWTQIPPRVGAISLPTAELDPGIRIRLGVVLPAEAIPFLNAVRAAFDPDYPLTVSSGTRTPAQQADAMWTKFKLGGTEELYRTYPRARTYINLLLSMVPDGPPTDDPPTAWATQIAAWMKQGFFISGHLRGRGLDLSIKDPATGAYWPPTVVSDLVSVIEDLRPRRVLREGNPPHVHVELPEGYVVPDPATPDTGTSDTSVYGDELGEDDIFLDPDTAQAGIEYEAPSSPGGGGSSGGGGILIALLGLIGVGYALSRS